MPEQPLVSVVIPNWNGAALLDDCFRGLAAQRYRPVEVVFVDNASGDDSRERFAAWTPPDGMGKTLVALPENQGFARAVNRGIEASRGEIVALLNNDTEADASWLSAAVERFGKRPDIGWCASKLVCFDERHRLDTAGHGFSAAGAGFARLRWAPDGPAANEEREVFGACGAAVLYRRAALEQTGLFDEDFFMYQEDLDLDCRLQLAGWRCLYVPASVVYHKVSASAGGSRSDFIVYHSSRNQEWLYLKCFPGRLLWTRLPAHALYNLGRFAVYALKGQAWPFLKGKWHAFRELGRALDKRRAVQATRRIHDSHFAARLDRRWFRRHFVDHLWPRG